MILLTQLTTRGGRQTCTWSFWWWYWRKVKGQKRQYKSHLKAIWKCSQGKMHASKGSKVLLLISLDKEDLEGHPWQAQWRRQLLLGCVQKRAHQIRMRVISATVLKAGKPQDGVVLVWRWRLYSDKGDYHGNESLEWEQKSGTEQKPGMGLNIRKLTQNLDL